MILLSFSLPVIAADSEEPGFTITFLGTGVARPSLLRSGPSILVEAGPQHHFLIDAGWGVQQQLLKAGGFEMLTSINHILITHMHYDHTFGLPDIWLMGWLFGRREPLYIMGPPGISAMMDSIQKAYAWDLENRRLVGVPMTGTEIIASDHKPGVLYEGDGLTITAFEVNHAPVHLQTGEVLGQHGTTFGYRIDYKGRSAVFSGDTAPSKTLEKYAGGVDVLVHETQVPSPGNSKEAALANVSLSVHTTPQQAGGIFSRTKPRMAVYSHIIPPGTTSEALTAATRPYYKGPLTVAHDLMTIRIGEEIIIGERERSGNESFERSSVLK